LAIPDELAYPRWVGASATEPRDDDWSALGSRSRSGGPLPTGWFDQAPVTGALIALNVAVFLVEVGITRSATDLPTPAALELGACNALAVVGDHRFETLVTACFLHAGILHVGFNMLALSQAGPLVERAAGSARLAPMYLLAGILGNAASVAVGWLTRTGGFTVGASGAITGVIAAAVVLGYRAQGWRGPVTQAMAKWLGFVLLFGLASNRLGGGRIDNAAHVGGALTGAVVAALWTHGYRYSAAMTRASIGASTAVLLASIATVAWRDRTDPFATMMLQDRVDYTQAALNRGNCPGAREGLAAVERLRGTMAHVTSLNVQVEQACGPEGSQ
jgi:rhomboid protease GluP